VYNLQTQLFPCWSHKTPLLRLELCLHLTDLGTLAPERRQN